LAPIPLFIRYWQLNQIPGSGVLGIQRAGTFFHPLEDVWTSDITSRYAATDAETQSCTLFTWPSLAHERPAHVLEHLHSVGRFHLLLRLVFLQSHVLAASFSLALCLNGPLGLAGICTVGLLCSAL